MRNEITGGIHNLYAKLPVLYPYMHVQPENQICPCYLTHFVYYFLVAGIFSDQHIFPMCKRVGSCSSTA